MPARVINLTPHPITLEVVDDAGRTGWAQIMPEATPARCADLREAGPTLTVKDRRLEQGGQPCLWRVRLNTKRFGELSGLPDEQPGVYCVVSLPVAEAARALGRFDCLVPDELARDAQGRIVGARALARLS